jgi:hypothetical protein
LDGVASQFGVNARDLNVYTDAFVNREILEKHENGFNRRAGTALWEADAGRNFGVSGEQV